MGFSKSPKNREILERATNLTGNESPLFVSISEVELTDVPFVFTEPEIDSDIMQSAKTNFDIQNK